MLYPPTKPYIGKRVAATLIDYTLIYLLSFFYIDQVGTPDSDGVTTVTGFPALVPVAFWFLYFVIAEYFWGGTLGHKLLGLKIVATNKQPVTFSQVLVRRIADALEIAWCFGLIAFIIAKSTPNAQRLGDLWAGTLVTGKDVDLMESQFDFDQEHNN